VARQWLFEPRDVERFEVARDRECFGERPSLFLLNGTYRPALVRVDHQREVGERLAHLSDDLDVLAGGNAELH
jgi:hypothetical protein